MIDPGFVFGKRPLPTIPSEEHFQKVRMLLIPKDDKDKIETNLEQARREAYEEHAKDEVPRLRNINAVLASDYFRYGWEAAIAKYSIAIVKQTFEFTPTNIQIATVMALTGTNKQKEEARIFFRQFLSKI